MYKNLLFDWDGTICDSGRGIIEAVRYAAEKLNKPDMPDEKLRKFVGPPLYDSFTSIYGMSEEETEKAIGLFREKYRGETITHAELYPGICEILQELSQDYTLYVATSKPEDQAVRLVEHFGIKHFFRAVCGSYSDTVRTRKHEVIAYLLEEYALNKEDCLMIGDTSNDVLGAAKCGMDCAGVLWGYGSREELEENHATFLVEKPSDLKYI